jgi:sugar phosphate isomerase/epimerase
LREGRLIESTGGGIVGANLVPSHLMWMGADIPIVMRTLGDAIFHVRAKDIHINDWISARDGLLDTVFITELRSRAWDYGCSDSAILATRSSGPTSCTTYGPLAMTTMLNSVEAVRRAIDLLKQVALVHPPDGTPANV